VGEYTGPAPCELAKESDARPGNANLEIDSIPVNRVGRGHHDIPDALLLCRALFLGEGSARQGMAGCNYCSGVRHRLRRPTALALDEVPLGNSPPRECATPTSGA